MAGVPCTGAGAREVGPEASHLQSGGAGGSRPGTARGRKIEFEDRGHRLRCQPFPQVCRRIFGLRPCRALGTAGGAEQQFHVQSRGAFQHREHVGFPVAHGDHASIGTGLGQFRGTVQTRQPACAFRGLRFLRRRRPEAGIHFQHAQRSPCRRDGQREMHGQPLHALSAASQFRQPLAGRQPRIVQHGGVLHRQHHRFQTAAIHRGLAMCVQHMLLRDTRIRQQAIGSFLLCRGGKHLRQGQARTIGPGAPHVHQPPPQARIAQRACAIFPIGPVRLYRPMPGPAPHGQPSPGFRAQRSSPMPRQRMHPDRLRRRPAPARRTTGGAPRATLPARRPIARPGAGRIHVSILQQRCRSTRSPPLRRECLRRLREHMGSQVRYPYPRKNQKPRLPNHRLQMCDPRGFRPADPAIPTGLVPARRRPSHPAQATLAARDNPAVQRSARTAIPSPWMMRVQQATKRPHVLRRHTSHRDLAQCLQRTVQRQVRIVRSRCPDRCHRTRRRQRHPQMRRQLRQRLAGRRDAPLPLTIPPVFTLANPPSQGPPSRRRIPRLLLEPSQRSLAKMSQTQLHANIVNITPSLVKYVQLQGTGPGGP